MLWEVIKTIGSIVGMITGLFVVWDRFFRNEPSAFIVAYPLIPGGKQKGAYVRVMNHSERPIIVSWPKGSQPNAIRIALSSSETDVRGVLNGGRIATVIDGKQELLLPLLKPNNWESIEEAGTARVVIKWRFVQRRIWPFDRSIRVSIKKRSWKTIVNETDD
jgi:hypothetical protein